MKKYIATTLLLAICMFFSQLHCLAEGLTAHRHAGHSQPGTDTHHHHHHEHKGKHSHDQETAPEELDTCCQNSLAIQISDFSKKFQSFDTNTFTQVFVFALEYELLLDKRAENLNPHSWLPLKNIFYDSLSIVPNAPPLRS